MPAWGNPQRAQPEPRVSARPRSYNLTMPIRAWIEALARSATVSDLAARHRVSRKFVYQQAHKASVGRGSESRASGVQNVREVLHINALSFDRLLALGISSQN